MRGADNWLLVEIIYHYYFILFLQVELLQFTESAFTNFTYFHFTNNHKRKKEVDKASHYSEFQSLKKQTEKEICVKDSNLFYQWYLVCLILSAGSLNF